MGRIRIAGLTGIAALVVALVGGGPGASAQSTSCANANAQPGSVSEAALATSVTCLINAQRASAGLVQLRPSAKLENSMRRHINDMLGNRFISHRGTDGSLPADRAREFGYIGRYKSFVVGESLAWGAAAAGTPAQVVGAWVNSPTHRRVLLDRRVRQIGSIVLTGSPVGAPGTAVDPASATYGINVGVVRKKRRR
jgi:uncharacterized protein YkwD